MRNYTRLFWSKICIFLLDLMVFNVGVVLFYAFEQRYNVVEMSYRFADDYRVQYWLLANVAYVIVAFRKPLNYYYRRTNFEKIFGRLVAAMISWIILFYAGIEMMSYPHVGLLYVALFALLFFMASTALHVASYEILSCMRFSGRNNKRVVLVGTSEKIHDLYRRMSHAFMGYTVVGIFTHGETDDVRPLSADGSGLQPRAADDLLAFLEQSARADKGVDEIYCDIPYERIDELINYCENHLIRLYMVPSIYSYTERSISSGQFDDIQLLSVRREPLRNPYHYISKRLFDIVFSGLFLVTLFPILYVVIGIAVKLSSPGPVFFKQERTGMNGQVFKCLKFRSMRVNAQSDTAMATRHDVRKTRVGEFLRKTSLDELPQFINVFKGEMSVVGPRPHMLKHDELYASMVEGYAVRHLIKPGITGLAQVSGFRGEITQAEDIRNRLRCDVEYLENWSFGLDMKIIVLTLYKVIAGDDKAY